VEHHELLTIAIVLAAGIACQWIAWRVKIPAILPLLITGFLAGPVLNLLHPQKQMGELFFPFVSLSVAVILFEGALTLTWSEVRTVRAAVRNLLTIGSLVSWVGGALAAHYILNLSWDLSLLCGALIIVTGPTVIAPLLRNVRPTANISSVLKWESILIDAIGATAAVLVFEFIAAEIAPENILITFLLIVTVGMVLGYAGGYLVHVLLRRYLVPDYLRDVVVLVLVALVFALSNALAPEAGLLAVTVMGIYLANTDLKKLREIWFFKEKLSVLLISTLFILLAANITLAELQLLDMRSVLVLLVVLFVLRPLGVFLSTIGSSLRCNERLFLAWIAPRGIVAAAVSSLFAFELVTRKQFPEARIVAPLTFLVIVGTVVLQGSTAKWLANRLGVREADPQGFLIMGANPFSIALATTLKEAGFLTRLVDSNWDNSSAARMHGLDVYYGNILSEYTEDTLDLGGIGRLLALTRNDEANALACKHFEEEFGSSNVYQLPPKAQSDAQNLSRLQLGRLLATQEATYDALMERMDAGANIKTTQLTAQYTYHHYVEQHVGGFVPLMMIRDREVRINTVEEPLAPEPGWTLVSLQLEPQRPGVSVPAQLPEGIEPR
jgi:NhaP-type Na+/H+ or K+/H+ antiporter